MFQKFLRISITSLSVIGSVMLQAQLNTEYSIQYFDVSKGLSNNFVSKIINDEKGFKWIASEGGLNKYDGVNFSLYKPGKKYPGLINENIETLYNDRNGFIWIGTKSGGLSRYNPRTDKFKSYNHIFKSDELLRVVAIAQDSIGQIWVGTWSKGVYVINPQSEKIVLRYIEKNKVADILADKYGNMWVAYSSGLLKYLSHEERFITVVEDEFVTDLLYDYNSNKILMAIGSVIKVVDMDFFKVEKFIETGFYSIESMIQDTENRVWIGTWGQGLYRSDSNLTKLEQIEISPPDIGKENQNYKSVLDITIDKTGDIWLATAYGGVVRLHIKSNIQYIANQRKLTKLSDNNIQSVYIDKSKNIWLGTYGGGINYSSDWVNFRRVDGNKLSKVNEFKEWNDRVFVCSREGLFSISKSNPNSGVTKYSDKRLITSLHIDKNSDIWVGTQQKGLFKTNLEQDPEIEQLKNCADKGINNKGGRISFIHRTQQGKLLVGTYNGLFLYNQAHDKFIRIDTNINYKKLGNIFHSISEDKQGKLWFGKPDGLVRASFHKGKFTVNEIYDRENKLADDFITSLAFDSNGELWLGKPTGVVKYLSRSNSFFDIGVQEEFPIGSMNINSVSKMDSLILMGGTNGLIVFNPNKISATKKSPETVFTTLEINNKVVEVGTSFNKRIILDKALPYQNEIVLKHYENVFSIHFAPTDFHGLNNLYYRYKLEGLSDNWIYYQNKNEISFTGLKAGKYILHIQASRDNLNYGKSSILKVELRPHPMNSKIAMLFYLVLALVMLWMVRRVIIKQTELKGNIEIAKIEKEKSQKLTEAKLRFFTNISHEFRTPLTLIIGPLEELIADKKITGKTRDKIQSVQRNASRLLDLINQLLEFRKAQYGLLKLNLSNGDLVNLTHEIFILFQVMAESKQIKYQFKSDYEKINANFDKDKMEIAISNLLSNAMKYTAEGGAISVHIGKNEECFTIKIVDTGSGLSEGELKKIFDRFYQVETSDSAKVIGSGIGLSLTKAVVELHGGKIFVNSQKGQGTEFTIEIPIIKPEGLLSIKQEEIEQQKSEVDLKLKTEKANLSLTATKDKEHTLLIVEDNDEIRSYLASILEADYKILQAENGALALEITKRELPDLVISDLMMPVMDGLEYCKKVKSNIETSHVPIILLTARTSTVHEVDGLKSGANDYIRKPFNPAIIKSRISALLENRKRYREHLTNKIRFEPIDADTTDFEEQFLHKVITLVENNLTNPDFGIKNLMEELYMSQSTLFRKVKSLTGLSISGFIRSVRLKMAAKIILEQNIKLSQVAYDVGFNDYKYFKKSFVQQYNCLPSEYKAKKLGK